MIKIRICFICVIYIIVDVFVFNVVSKMILVIKWVLGVFFIEI